MTKVIGATEKEIKKQITKDHLKIRYDDKTKLNWIYTTVRGKAENYNTIANQLVRDNDHLNIIIQRDRKLTETKNTKENAVLKDLKELKKLLKDNHHLYEVKQGDKPRYFFVDIDIDKYKNVNGEEVKNLTDEEIKYVRENDMVEILKNRIEEILNINLDDVVVLQSLPDTRKKSYHVIFKDIKLRNAEESNVLFNYIIKYIHDPVLSKQNVIDPSIYGRNSAMRLRNQTKIDKEEQLKCVSGHKGYDKMGLTCIYEEQLKDDDFFIVDDFREKNKNNEIKKHEKTRGDIEKVKGRNGTSNILCDLNKGEGVKAEPDYEEEDDIRYLLTCIPNYPLQPYNIWLFIGFILKNQDSDVNYWIEWTNRGYQYHGEDKTDDIITYWNSMGKNEEGLTFRSLLKMANYYVPNPLDKRVITNITRNDEINIENLDLHGIDREVYEKKIC